MFVRRLIEEIGISEVEVHKSRQQIGGKGPGGSKKMNAFFHLKMECHFSRF